MSTVYACHNRLPFTHSRLVQNGMDGHHRPMFKVVPIVGTRECQYTKTTLGKADIRCAAYKHKEVA